MNIHAQDIQEFSTDLSDREIYNDIRAECDILDILDLYPEAMPEFFTTFTAQGAFVGLSSGASMFVTITPRSPDHVEVHWSDEFTVSASGHEMGWTQEECDAVGGDFSEGYSTTSCWIDIPEGSVHGFIYDSDERQIRIWLTNDSAYNTRGLVYVSYMAITPEWRFYKLRSCDETSIRKYGRRVMDLKWPMGQHPTYMQRIIDRYLERHSEPVCVANMLLVGKSAEIAQNILELDINDRVTITHPVLNIPREEEGDYEYEGFETEWFVNSIDCVHSVGGVLEGYFDLEQVRIMERYPDSHEPVDRYEYEYEGG